jgi:hypothetical protein
MIEAWDRGELITTLEMGGLGPGYEQAIQYVAVEFARATKGIDPENLTEFRQACDAALSRLDEDYKGITGAMFGAAEWLAAYWRKHGPETLITEARSNGEGARVIFAKKSFP